MPLLPSVAKIVINLISLNINGLSDIFKRAAVIEWLKCMKADIICLQETHAASQQAFSLSPHQYFKRDVAVAILIRDTVKITEDRKDHEA